MVFGEGALAEHRCHHGYLEQLRKFDELVRRLRVEHALSREDHRALRVDERSGRCQHVTGVGGGKGRGHGRVRVGGVADVGLQDVGGKLDHDGAGSAVVEAAEGAAHDLGEPLRVVKSLDPLGDGVVADLGAEDGRHAGDGRGLTERYEQHRRGVRVSGCDARKGVLRPGPVLHREHGRPPPVRDPSKAVRNPNAHALLPADDGPHAHGGRRVDDGRSREAAQVLNVLALQNVDDGVNSLHSGLRMCEFA